MDYAPLPEPPRRPEPRVIDLLNPVNVVAGLGTCTYASLSLFQVWGAGPFTQTGVVLISYAAVMVGFGLSVELTLLDPAYFYSPKHAWPPRIYSMSKVLLCLGACTAALPIGGESGRAYKHLSRADFWWGGFIHSQLALFPYIAAGVCAVGTVFATARWIHDGWLCPPKPTADGVEPFSPAVTRLLTAISVVLIACVPVAVWWLVQVHDRYPLYPTAAATQDSAQEQVPQAKPTTIGNPPSGLPRRTVQHYDPDN